MNLNNRTVKYFNADHYWVDINPEDLKKNMVFQVFGESGEPVDEDGIVILTAAEDAKNIGGNITIKIIKEDL